MPFTYRKIPSYKYQSLTDVFLSLPGTWQSVYTPYISICANTLVIQQGYAWDGTSGPAIDTEDSMRASLVHDALYQLIRQGYLARDRYRPRADRLFYQLCLKDGMPPWRAWYMYWAVRLFGRYATISTSLDNSQ